jgi:hypothetical protein
MSDAAPHGKKKKKHRQPEPEADPEFQIAPMIDILLVLLVFFMSISSTEVLQSNKDIRLPVAKDAKDAKENPGQIIVNLAINPLSGGIGISLGFELLEVLIVPHGGAHNDTIVTMETKR